MVHLQQRFETRNIAAGNYMFNVNNRNTRARCEICSKLAIKTQERRPGIQGWREFFQASSSICISSIFKNRIHQNFKIFLKLGFFK